MIVCLWSQKQSESRHKPPKTVFCTLVLASSNSQPTFATWHKEWNYGTFAPHHFQQRLPPIFQGRPPRWASAHILVLILFSHTSQEIGWEEHLRNDVFCVECDVKPEALFCIRSFVFFLVVSLAASDNISPLLYKLICSMLLLPDSYTLGYTLGWHSLSTNFIVDHCFHFHTQLIFTWRF